MPLPPPPYQFRHRPHYRAGLHRTGCRHPEGYALTQARTSDLGRDRGAGALSAAPVQLFGFLIRQGHRDLSREHGGGVLVGGASTEGLRDSATEVGL